MELLLPGMPVVVMTEQLPLLCMSGEKATELGVKPFARIVDWAQTGVSPEIMGIGPVPAVRKLLERTGKTLDERTIYPA